MLLRGQGGSVDAVEVRFTVGLPAQGRNVMGQWAYGTRVQSPPSLMASPLFYATLPLPPWLNSR